MLFRSVTTLEAFGVAELAARDPRAAILAMAERVPGLFGWLDGLAHAVRWRDVCFVHGGLVPGGRAAAIGTASMEHLVIRDEFFGAPWTTAAFGGYEAAGIRRVVFGHTPMPGGPRLFHDGRSIDIDTNAPGALPGPRSVTLLELAGDVAFADARRVEVPADRAAAA